jgi:hypothetical protein
MKKLLLLVAVSALGLGLAGCGEEPAPDFPTYTNNVAPLLGARCVRCHGAGGTTNDDPYSPPPVLIDKTTGLPAVTKEKPATKLDTYASAKGGVALFFAIYLGSMPPPPSPPLTDRELEILSRWNKNPLQ